MFWRGRLKWGSACGQHGGTACGGSKKAGLYQMYSAKSVFAEYAAGGRHPVRGRGERKRCAPAGIQVKVQVE